MSFTGKGWLLGAVLLPNCMIKTANIAGAGLGGLTAAIALARRGVRVQIYEQSPVLGAVGAGIQLSPNAVKVLRALEIEPSLRPFAFEPENAVIRNGATGAKYVSLPLKGAAEQKYGAPYLHIHRADLHRVLVEHAEDLGVSIALNQRMTGYNEAGFHGVATADIAIAADGVKSPHAMQMNENQPARFTGQVAWRGVIDAAQLPPNTIPSDATVWTGSDQHIVTYYLRAGSLVNFVAVEERTDWQDASWTTAGDVTELRRVFSGWHPRIETLLRAVSDVNIWALYDKPELTRWSDGLVVLLGDSCHPTLPFLAQGAAMAMEDAFVLSDCLAQASDPQAAFRSYEAARKPRTTLLQQKARANADLFHRGGPFGGQLSLAKLNVARMLPVGLAARPFDGIYSYDVTQIKT